MRFPIACLKVERNTLEPDQIRALVAKGKARGLIRDSATPATIHKTGTELATEGAFRTQWMDVSPAMATDWLRNNFRNRTMSDDVIKAYARDMASGVWTATHQGIAFNDLDQLIDGQHRLRAIILSGVTVRMMVTFGLASKIEGREMTTMDAVDRGRTRSVADQLKIQHGMKNGSAIAMICASLAGLCQQERTRKLSVGQTLEIYREFQAEIDWVIDLKPREHGLKSKGVLAAVAFAITAAPELKPVCRMLFAGGDFAGPNPVGHLRKFLTSPDAILLNRGTDRGIAELTLEALFLHTRETQIGALFHGLDGLHHFRSLQPQRVAKIAAFFALP